MGYNANCQCETCRAIRAGLHPDFQSSNRDWEKDAALARKKILAKRAKAKANKKKGRKNA